MDGALLMNETYFFIFLIILFLFVPNYPTLMNGTQMKENENLKEEFTSVMALPWGLVMVLS